MTSHLVGLSEIATMLGVSRQRVGQLVRDYEDFPSPVAELASGRIWETAAVEVWANAHPVRPPGRPASESGQREEA
jgi:predicted DNA-binding transcriptional regulator AlpA